MKRTPTPTSTGRTICLLVCALLLGALLLGSVPGLAAESGNEAPLTFQIPRIDQEIKIDGVLDEPAWQGALIVGLGFETRPGENVKPPVETECRLLYSKSHLYYSCHAYDDPKQIVARLSDRDQAQTDDTVGIAIDPFDSQNRSYVLDVNPLGVQNDRLYTEADGRSDPSWDAIWESAGKIVDDGFVVEAAIPFSQLRFPRVHGPQTWSFSMRRYQPRDVYRRIALTPNDRNNRCRICQNPKLVGFEGIDPGRSLEVTPTLTAVRNQSLSSFPDGSLVGEGADYDPGLSVRWGVTPNLALNGTVNPDFSQVEADVAQLDVNRQFALFFPERRPFFLEGQDLFATPIRAVHTRSVADPSWGVKLTGKEGANAIGGFVAQDEVTNLLLPGSEGSSIDQIQGDSSLAVLRYRRDLADASTVGVLFTDREAGRYSNRVGGIDSRLRLTTADTLRFQVLGSQTTYSSEVARRNGLSTGQLEDLAIDFNYGHDTRNWAVGMNYGDYGDDFRADLGFLPQVGIRELGLGGEYRWFGDSEHWFTRLDVGAEVDRTVQQDGRLLEEEASTFLSYSGPLQSHLGAGAGFGRRVFRGIEFDQRYAWIFGTARPHPDLVFGLEYSTKDGIDFANVQPGKGESVSAWVSYSLGRHLRGSLNHTFSQLDVTAGNLFEANLSELRLVYQINTRAFVRSILQYSRIANDPTLFSSPIESETRDLFGQLLFTYKLNPQTALYLGYSAAYDQATFHRAFQGPSPSSKPPRDSGLVETGNTLFAKLSFAWLP